MTDTTTLTLNEQQLDTIWDALNVANNIASDAGIDNAEGDDELTAEVEAEIRDTAAMMKRVEKALYRIYKARNIDTEAREWIAEHGRKARFADAHPKVVKRIRQLLNQ